MRFAKICAASILALSSTIARAEVVQPLPPSLAFEALSETMPTAMAPTEFSAQDFTLEWEGPPIAGMEVKLEARSFEWVRVEQILVLPRARASFRIERGKRGFVKQAGFSQPLIADASGSLSAELPVALLSGTRSEIEVEVDGTRGKLRTRFHPREATARGVTGVDPTCSRFGVTASEVGAEASRAQPDWLYIGCRLVGVEGPEHRTSSLELYVLWDGIGSSIDVDGTATPEESASVWLLRLRAEPGKIRLKGKQREIEVSYQIPGHLHRGFVGAGIGPYTYFYQSRDEETKTGAAALNIYGSYQLADTIRAVAFDATTFTSQLTTDFGLYVNSEQFRTFDRRVALNIMLGAHLIGFKTHGTYLVFLGAPQGIEIQITDFLGRNRNLAAGAFIYPSISGNSYINTWLRWGSPAFFGEINYITWQEATEDRGIFSSRSLGISLGFPIARFL